MTKAQIEAFADELIDVMKDALAPLQARLETLEAAMGPIAEKQAPRNRGAWMKDHVYRRAEMVECDGDLWVCKALAVKRRPSTEEGNGWLLIRKHPA